MPRILIADDDHRLTRSLAEGLRCEGYAVDVVADGDEAVFAAESSRYDAVLLDVQMPRRNGYQVVRALRAARDWTPVLMLTAKDGEYDEAEGLDCGADDYLTKPFSYVVLLARLRSLLRRGAGARPVSLHVAGLDIDLVARQVRRGMAVVPLTVKEFEMLAALARRAGEPVAKSALAQSVWDEAADVADNRIEVYISALRRKIDAPFGTDSIETLRGYGYRIRL
ncbi:two-component system OmpR family response regulator [Mycobacterium frederiksbergense]|uniref:Two-component system OmpR family response regulator n=1 Tax=Mycolicibacterium frederiksbergense TaxID=117567 RepID=A0ABT6KZ23_9MYCO|nr:response regulator transcription factor [Mycolicibacterium frederiksbergense]MDH6195571.1 two-component system OmpR family response regulator [Mycolicibacterium frederiksbergense]